ncbi:nucleoside phosphorylase [Halovenus rubra]|uniref:Nucleoside phosphorylase n=2 Tax=Halovenus rubra TaxID=869890 RepID=A0ACC7E293_9EURY|nr:nucleoside phosphorylase [Halovenus rubra]
MPDQHKIPNYDDKYTADALFSPIDAMDVQGQGVPDVPPTVILGYQEALTAEVRDRASGVVDIVRSQQCYLLSDAVGYVPVHESGVGAPVTAMIVENVIAAGAGAVVMLGGCACLQTEISPHAAILPTETIRDEGVSYHYVPAEEGVVATEPLVDELETALSAAGFETPRGRTWTTSAMYRETVPEIEQYQNDGVVSLCMESAAIWAVCQYRGVDAATVHKIGDYLNPGEWVPDSGDKKGLPDMLTPTIDALTEHVESA